MPVRQEQTQREAAGIPEGRHGTDLFGAAALQLAKGAAPAASVRPGINCAGCWPLLRVSVVPPDAWLLNYRTTQRCRQGPGVAAQV